MVLEKFGLITLTIMKPTCFICLKKAWKANNLLIIYAHIYTQNILSKYHNSDKVKDNSSIIKKGNNAYSEKINLFLTGILSSKCTLYIYDNVCLSYSIKYFRNTC